MKKWIVLIGSGLFTLYGLLLIKNSFSYKDRSLEWRAGKSFADFLLITLAGLRLPALLTAWCVWWLTRPVKRTGIRITYVVIATTIMGIAASPISGAMEILMLMSVFAIDLVTGAEGFLGYFWKAEPRREIVA